MRSKRIPADEQFRLIMECRQSGLSDYQWCQMQDINPATFYNWISRLRKRGMVIPDSSGATRQPASPFQEVVKVELIQEDALSVPMEQNTSILSSLANDVQPAVEILIDNATIRFFNSTEQNLVETTLKCLGGILHAG
jgi:transposase-like protein